MPHLSGAHGGDTSMAICTLLLILSTAFSSFAEGLSPGLPRRMYNSQSVLNFNDSQQVANLEPSRSHRQLRVRVNFPGYWSPFNGTSCSNKDISIFQGYNGPSDGIPQYSVQISNNCMSCDPWDIHVFCGWFASARLVNFNSFKRICHDDCLVNGGRVLRYGEILTFTYANNNMYPNRLKSATFCR